MIHKIYDTKELGSLIREARKSQNLTQTQLSSVCGVGVRFISEVEKGKVSSQIGKILVVIKMLGLEVAVAKRGELIS